MTQNLGVLPINLGPAKLQRTYHTLLHYYDLESLYEEFGSLVNQHKQLKGLLTNKTIYKQEMENYEKTAVHIEQTIQEKFATISPGHEIFRIKRGLYNHLGSTIKLITGNLDSEDGENIEKFLKQLERNQIGLQEQLKMQFSVTNGLIDKFNATLENIQHNEENLSNKIAYLSELTKESFEVTSILYVKELYSQILMLFNIINGLLQDIENSLAFCKLKTIHPSIIKPRELLSELLKISSFYKDELPFELTYENIPNFQNIIEVNCHLEKSKIVYLLSLPINFKTNFELYYLIPIPTLMNSQFITLMPSTKYLLKFENNFKPLTGRCTFNTFFSCPSKLLSSDDVTCEKQIILHSNTQNCKYVQLNIPQNEIELLHDINQYLAVFPHKDTLTLKCKQETQIENFNGIFLVDKEPCNIIYKEQELLFERKSVGKPLILKDINFTSVKLSDMKLELHNLELGEIPINIISSATPKPNRHFESLTISIVYLISIIICVLFFKKNPFRNRPTVDENNELAEIEIQPTVQLPGEARF